MTQYTVYFGKCSCALEKNVYFKFIQGDILKVSVRAWSLIIWFRSFIWLLFLFLSPHSVNYWGRGSKISSHDWQNFYFSHFVTQFLLYEFWSSVIRCNIKILMISCWVNSCGIMKCLPLSVEMLCLEVCFVLLT